MTPAARAAFFPMHSRTSRRGGFGKKPVAFRVFNSPGEDMLNSVHALLPPRRTAFVFFPVGCSGRSGVLKTWGDVLKARLSHFEPWMSHLYFALRDWYSAACDNFLPHKAGKKQRLYKRHQMAQTRLFSLRPEIFTSTLHALC